MPFGCLVAHRTPSMTASIPFVRFSRVALSTQRCQIRSEEGTFSSQHRLYCAEYALHGQKTARAVAHAVSSSILTLGRRRHNNRWRHRDDRRSTRSRCPRWCFGAGQGFGFGRSFGAGHCSGFGVCRRTCWCDTVEVDDG